MIFGEKDTLTKEDFKHVTPSKVDGVQKSYWRPKSQSQYDDSDKYTY